MRVLVSFLALAFIGISAQAEEVPAQWQTVNQKFSFSSFNSYYHCDVVKRMAVETLENLGAADIQVSCRGGLPDWDVNWITAEYSVLRSASEDKATTVGQVQSRELRHNDACDLNERMTRQFLKEFEVYDQKKSGVCRDSQGRVRFQVQLLSQ